MRRAATTLATAALALVAACTSAEPDASDVAHERASDVGGDLAVALEPLSSIDCARFTDTGYVSGEPFTIELVRVDGKPVEVATANAYYVMAQAAAAEGVEIRVVSGFRTMAEQEYLYACYVNCNCNDCNQAARPGYSNHQSGHALDLNTSAPGVYAWLSAHGGAYGFKRTVPGEAWHWEWWGGGPGGGPCAACAPHCEGTEIVGADCGRGDCGAFGLSCIIGLDGAPTCGNACAPHCEGTVIVGADCGRGDCGAFGASCAMASGAPTCVVCTPHCEGTQIVGGDCGRGDCAAFGLTCTIALDGAPACGNACAPHCEGSVIVAADCGRGDCGAFGANCNINENGTPFCQLPCAPHCEGTIAVGADCSRGDCGAFGTTCSMASGAPQCVAPTGCVPHCEGPVIVGADCDRGDCSAFGLTCADFGGGPECVTAGCAPHCEGPVIVGADCGRGDCSVFGLTCSSLGGAPHCVSELCTAPDQPPLVHDICFDAKRYTCDAQGVPREHPVDEACNLLDDDCDGLTDEGTTNACGACGAVPNEVCNHLDDDCDGVTDDGVTNACGSCGPQPPETCNGLDDDCDGATDEDFALGGACAAGEGACATSGVMACDDAGGAACQAVAATCDDGDPCSDDGCDPAVGCTHAMRPIEQCASGLCAPCERDDECAGAGSACVGYAFGAACATACDAAASDSCPEGFACTEGPDGAVCVFDGERCGCAPNGKHLCDGDVVVRYDTCDHVIARDPPCPDGCRDGACVGPDPDPVADPDPDPDADTHAEPDPEPDAGDIAEAEVVAEATSGATHDDGCAGCTAGADPASIGLALAFLALVRHRARKRDRTAS